MLVFRIVRGRFASEALKGDGARRDGGRWNSRGNAVVYAATSRSLAVLETLVHVDPDTAPNDLVLLTVNVPDTVSVETVTTEQLPTDWRRIPAPEALADFGDQWVREGRSGLLRVPSAILPAEQCVLINPSHEDSAGISMAEQEPLILDPRLL